MATTQATIARNIAGTDGLWHHAGTKLAEDVPHYMNKDNGRPNFHHITTAAKNMGYDEINADNLAQVIQELRDRVDAPEDPAPNVQEPEPAPAIDPAALVAACERLPEAPVVAFTDLISPDGFRWCITVRAGLPPDLAQQSVSQTISLMKMVENGTTAKGWSAPGNGRKNAPAQVQAGPVAGSNGTGQFNPDVMEYAGKSGQGDKYWRCKGRPFTQHGVIVWEEVLPDELKQMALADLSEDVSLSGWVAIYSQKEHRDEPGEMTPDKVVELRKAA